MLALLARMEGEGLLQDWPDLQEVLGVWRRRGDVIQQVMGKSGAPRLEAWIAATRAEGINFDKGHASPAARILFHALLVEGHRSGGRSPFWNPSQEEERALLEAARRWADENPRDVSAVVRGMLERMLSDVAGIVGEFEGADFVAGNHDGADWSDYGYHSVDSLEHAMCLAILADDWGLQVADGPARAAVDGLRPGFERIVRRLAEAFFNQIPAAAREPDRTFAPWNWWDPALHRALQEEALRRGEGGPSMGGKGATPGSSDAK